MRVLVLAHHHPEVVSGGGEWAAYSLFRALREDPRVDYAAFVAHVPETHIGHSAKFGCFRGRPDEIVVNLPMIRGFTLESSNPDALEEVADDLIRYTRPDILHLHHVLNWGIETIDIFARRGVRLVMTLHEFMLICHNYGQMRRTSGELCYAASPVDCALCFPKYTPGKFFIRTGVIQALLKRVDAFVAPSRFLADRFLAWSPDELPISVIENILGRHAIDSDPPAETRSRGAGAAGGKPVVGFFGQFTPFKGVDLLLEAYAMLPEPVQAAIELRIHGENRSWRDSDFRERLEVLFRAAGPSVRRYGAYRNEEVIKLMRECDWVVVPSIWWENSPVVIQEAKLAGCRILCADIGGMAEKTEPGRDIRFSPGNARALARRLEEIASGRSDEEISACPGSAIEKIAAQNDDSLQGHLEIYTELLSLDNRTEL